MNKYVEGIVENIERRGATKSLILALSGKNIKKDVVFFEDFISIRSNDGALHSVRVEDDNAVSVGEEIFLFKNEKDVAVEIYKAKEKVHENLDTSKNDGDIMKNNLKDAGFISNGIGFFMLLYGCISIPMIPIFLLADYLSESVRDFATNHTYICNIGLFSSIGLLTALKLWRLWKKSLSDEKKEKERLQKMVDDFRKDHSEKGVEVSQEANVIVR